MNSFKTYLESKNLSKESVESYYGSAMEYINHLEDLSTELEASSSREVTHFLQKLQKRGLSNSTRNTRLLAIKHLYDYAIHHKRTAKNPARQIKIRGL